MTFNLVVENNYESTYPSQWPLTFKQVRVPPTFINLFAKFLAIQQEYFSYFSPKIKVLFVLFELYIAFNINLSVIYHNCARCDTVWELNVHWNIAGHTPDKIFHPVTLYWHWADQFGFLELSAFLMLSTKRKNWACTIFKVIGITRLGSKPAANLSQSGCYTNWATVPVQS